MFKYFCIYSYIILKEKRLNYLLKCGNFEHCIIHRKKGTPDLDILENENYI